MREQGGAAFWTIDLDLSLRPLEAERLRPGWLLHGYFVLCEFR